MRHRRVPKGTVTTIPEAPVRLVVPDDATPLGSKWYMDFKDFHEPDMHGNTGFVLFVEHFTLYIVVVLLLEHHGFWDAAQDLVDTMLIGFSSFGP